MVGRRGVVAAAAAGAAALAGLSGCGSTAPALTSAPSPSTPERAWPFPRATLHPALHLVGDSTMADKPLVPLGPHPERGWGQLLREFMREPARLVNHAANGRSTRRFVDEGRWAHVLTELQRGDFVLIQFGHNDQKADDPKRYAAANTDFKAYLRRFIADVRERGATPLLATPVVRRKFDSAGRIVNTLGEWPQALRDVAAETGSTLIDMNKLTATQLEAVGPDASRSLFMHIAPGVWGALPQGRLDDTHYVAAGARATAALGAKALREQVPGMRDWWR